MQIFIFVFYGLLFCWLTSRIPFFKKAGIGKWLLIGLFILKILAGLAYAWYYALPQNIATADTWKYFRESLKETDWLLRDPVAFIKDLFYSPYQSSGNLFSGNASYWNDLKDNAFIKFFAVINVFTAKSYYTALIIFNFLFLVGPVALFRMIKRYIRFHPFWGMVPLLLPSFLFWCSGIHKDGLIFSALALSWYLVWKQVCSKRFIVSYTLIIFVCFVALFALRNIILFLLVPALTAYIISEKKPRHKWFVFFLLYVTGIVLFFVLPLLSAKLNFPQYIITKQAEFKELTGASRISLPLLEPNFSSFAHFFPYAVDIAFFRPHAGELASPSYIMAWLENSAILLLIIVWMIWHKPFKSVSPVLISLLFYSLSLLLLCGYTVTFTGAVVRYKSLVTPLLCCFLILTFDYGKIYFINRKRNPS